MANEAMTEREINIAIALFMGWHQWTDLAVDYDGLYPMFAVWNDDESLSVYEDEASGDVTRYWSPATKIEHAFEVVEKMQDYKTPSQDGHPLTLQYEWWNEQWRATLGAAIGFAKTPMRAICDSALNVATGAGNG
jgi:hypothetical protein